MGRRPRSPLRLRRFLAGEDGPGRRALPAGELLHPVPLLAVAILAVNDHMLKGSALPGWLTGKLSDLAGLMFFPLLLTAVADVVLLAAARLRLAPAIDFSLRRWKLAAAILVTGAGFSAIKLSPEATAVAAWLWAWLWPGSHLICDPTDLIALPALALAWLVGRRQIARVPLGRLEVIERRARARRLAGEPLHRLVVDEMADVGAPGFCAGFAAYLDGADGDDARAALELLRD